MNYGNITEKSIGYDVVFSYLIVENKAMNKQCFGSNVGVFGCKKQCEDCEKTQYRFENPVKLEPEEVEKIREVYNKFKSISNF